MTNEFKSKHGKSSKEQLESLLKKLNNKGYVKDYVKNYKVGYKNQFSFNFLVVLNENEKWIIQTTTSYRKDRAQKIQYNALKIKEYNDEIDLAILSYPDSVSSKVRDGFRFYKQRIKDSRYESFIDEVMSHSEIYNFIEQNNLSNFNLGKAKALKGNNFEEIVVYILNNKSNQKKWNGETAEVGSRFDYFSQIMESFNFNEQIKNIQATNEIPRLPSGGLPKTDISVKLNGNIYTISCKRSKKNWVSVHEYSVSDFINALEIDDYSLIKALEKFQQYGGIRKLKSEEPQLAEKLEEKLPDYNKKLALWVYGGFGGVSNNNLQLAKYILVYDENNIHITHIKEYVNYILNNVEGQFRTPFRWTYPSGGKGERIQLKGKIK